MWCAPLSSVRLLAALLVMAGCVACQQEQPESSVPHQDRDGAEEFSSQAVRSAIQPLLQPLLDGLERITSQLNVLETRLDNQSHMLERLATRLDSQDLKLEKMTARLLNNQDLQVCTNSDNSTSTRLLRDCSDLSAGTCSGIHLLQPDLDPSQPPVAAYCDMETDGGGWTVIQRRADIQPRQDFYLGWTEYREGFGDLEKEFWWGLQNIWKVASAQDRQYQLRVDLQDFGGDRRYAVYGTFRVASESDGYRLLLKNYTGNAGDSMSWQDGHRFSTKDKDQDESKGNCAVDLRGAWWYSDCAAANLNGQYLSNEAPAEYGVYWFLWTGWYYSLEAVEMKIKPV